MNSKIRQHKLFLALLGGLVMVVVSVTVAVAAGNIDGTNKWAWGTNVGWINFADANGGVTAYSDHLEGYAWGENVGWIRLGTCTGGSPCTYANNSNTNYGVNDDGVGNLSGYAWGTNAGWINFKPTHGGVTVDPVTGDFDGYAWGENVGWIHFQNASPAYKVNTTWRGDLTGTYQNGVAAIITTRRPGPASSNGLIIANSTFLNDAGDGIIFGHDNGTGTTTANLPSGVINRWARIWQLDVNDGVGTTGGNVTLTFDFSDAGRSGTPSGTYKLLKRAGTSGDFSVLATSTSFSGDQVIFDNVSAGDLGSYFTLGTSNPTAVTLQEFTVHAAGSISGLALPLALVVVVTGGLVWWRSTHREPSAPKRRCRCTPAAG
jgi:hypothetical protein